MRIGIYGGAFDPIHLGHINPILEIVQKHKLERVHFIPTHISNSNKKIVANSEERLLMIKKSIEDIANFIVDDREIKRGGRSFTYDTIKEIRAENPKAQLYCIIGDDLLTKINSWKSFDEIIKLSNILVTCRNRFKEITIDNNISCYMAENESIFHDQSYGKIFIENTSIVDVSSKEIRHRLKNNKPISGLVNVNLEKWLEKNKVY